MTQTPEKAKRRWLMPAFIASLTLNLLVAGVLVGWVLSPEGPRRERFDTHGVIGEPFFRALPVKDRRALIGDILRDPERFREGRDGLRQRFDAFLAALRADPFVPGDVKRLLAEQSEVAIGRQKIGEDLLVQRLESMSGEERAAYADRLEDMARRFKRRD